MISGNYSTNFSHPDPSIRVEPVYKPGDRKGEKNEEPITIDVEFEEVLNENHELIFANSRVNSEYFVYNSEGKLQKLRKPKNTLIVI